MMMIPDDKFILAQGRPHVLVPVSQIYNCMEHNGWIEASSIRVFINHEAYAIMIMIYEEEEWSIKNRFTWRSLIPSMGSVLSWMSTKVRGLW